MKKFHIFLWMIFFAFLCHTLIIINVNVAIISMVNAKPKFSDAINYTKNVICDNTTFSWDFIFPESIISTSFTNKRDTFDWSPYEKSVILSAIHWLSWLLIFPGSILSQRYGSKVVVGYGLGMSAVLSSLIPFVAYHGYKFVAAVRMVQGLLLGITFPGGIMTVAGNWTSAQNRGKFVAAIIAGLTTASSFGTYILGYIGKYLHWKYIFHLTSLCGIVCTTFWFYLIYDFPDQHPSMSIREKTKIREKRKCQLSTKNIPIPWKDIFTSIPFIICLISLGTVKVNAFVILTFAPLYFNNKYGFDSNQTGILVSLSNLFCAALALVLGWFTDYFARKQWFSITNTRKIYCVIGCALSSSLLVLMAMTKCDVTSSFIYFTLSASLRGVIVFGLEPALVDMSPKFCSVTHGLSGTTSEFMTMSFAMLINYLSKTLPLDEYWRLVFLLTAALPVIPSILFIIFGSAERQFWDYGAKEIQNTNHESHIINFGINRDDKENIEKQCLNNGT